MHDARQHNNSYTRRSDSRLGEISTNLEDVMEVL